MCGAAMRETVTKPQNRPRYRAVAIALVAFLLVGADQQQDLKKIPDLKENVPSRHSPENKTKIISHLKTASDDELKTVLNDILKLASFRSRAGYEPCLSEIIRRGGPQWELFLKEKFDILMKNKINPHQEASPFGEKNQLDEDEDLDEDLEPGSNFNLELLTALRRIKKQPDPLKVIIDGPQELTAASSPLALPRLGVRIENVDVDQTDVGFTFGGNYRSGLQRRWRIVVQDEKGNLIPARRQKPRTWEVLGNLFKHCQFHRSATSWKIQADRLLPRHANHRC